MVGFVEMQGGPWQVRGGYLDKIGQVSCEALVKNASEDEGGCMGPEAFEDNGD